MVDKLRKEVPCREELLAEYEKLCRDIEADAVAMLEGETSNRWRQAGLVDHSSIARFPLVSICIKASSVRTPC